MNNYIDCSKVYIDKSSLGGIGVFAKQDLKKDEVVEIGIMTVLKNVDGNKNPHLFTWSDDRKSWAAGSGCLPFYNHFYIPNIKKVGDLVNNTMAVYTLKDVKKGEELGNYYSSKKWRTCFQIF